VNNPQRRRTRGLFLAWLIAVGLMAIGFMLDRNVDSQHLMESAPELSRLSAKATLFTSVQFSLVELLVLYAILRPWTFTARTWYRALAALILFAPCAALLLLIGPGGSLPLAVHGLWVLAIVLTLFFTTIASFQARIPPDQGMPSP
jgi:hypothetical protein